MNNNAYKKSLDYLYNLQKYGMIFGLTQVRRILEAIGNPQDEVLAIHVGGTNGKGSTAAMMASILQKEGYRVGLYTSPHLISFTERIKINDKEIGEDEVANLTNWMRERIESKKIDNHFTFFDFTTAMALQYFKQNMVDLAILEVGLGGRLDSTNVVDPLLSIITNISKDHMEYLGRSILKIAEEKAGIIKHGKSLITAVQQPRVIHLFSEICRQKRSAFYRVGKDFRYKREGEMSFNYEGLNRKLWGVHINLMGFHQIINATTALGAIEVLDELGYTVSTEAMLQGLREVHWPGRLELVSTSPRVILDGAHNEAGAMVLKEYLEKESKYKRLILVIGIMKDKDIKSILNLLTPLASQVILTRPSIDRAASPFLLQKRMGGSGKKAIIIENLYEAIQKGLSLMNQEDLLCITGSLYTIGEAKAFFDSRGMR
jgi:dihydrofolate synthase/folylpolyglutamate synthase